MPLLPVHTVIVYSEVIISSPIFVIQSTQKIICAVGTNVFKPTGCRPAVDRYFSLGYIPTVHIGLIKYETITIINKSAYLWRVSHFST